MLYKKNKLLQDACIAIGVTLLACYLSIYFDFFEKWFNFTRAYEDNDLDELIGCLPGFFIGLLYFTYRLLTYVRKDNAHIYDLAESLEYEASYDHLTGLPNRRAFEKKLRDLIEESKSVSGNFTIFYIDIRKPLNEMGEIIISNLLLVVLHQRTCI